ncbi:MAG: alpha/beta fold hydrolase [Pyrinomonadaceae bacterium]
MKKRNLLLALTGAAGAAVAVKFLTRARSVNWDDIADQVPHYTHSHFVMVDGARVHYQEFGDAAKPALVLIHGYTASVYVWKTVAPMMAAAGFRVIAVDLLGFGYSEKPSWFDYSIQSQARMISRFMSRLGIGRATIVGSSYGGAVSLNLTLDYPEYVEKLVLVDAVCNDDPKSHPLLRLASLPGVGEVVTPFLLDSKTFLRARILKTLATANRHMATPERIESIRRPLFAADAHRSVLATSRNWYANRLEADAHLIAQPTLIIWGDSDQVIPIKNGYKLHREILNSRFVIFRNCGHVPPEEQSELFADLVTEFCRDKKGRIGKKDGVKIRLEE